MFRESLILWDTIKIQRREYAGGLSSLPLRYIGLIALFWPGWVGVPEGGSGSGEDTLPLRLLNHFTYMCCIYKERPPKLCVSLLLQERSLNLAPITQIWITYIVKETTVVFFVKLCKQLIFLVLWSDWGVGRNSGTIQKPFFENIWKIVIYISNSKFYLSIDI